MSKKNAGKHAKKGEFGYVAAEKKRKFLITAILFAVPLLIGNLLQQTYNIIDAAIVGHSLAQRPQFLHFSGSIMARLFSTLTASNLQAFSHFLHPMQPLVQAFLVLAPGSVE